MNNNRTWAPIIKQGESLNINRSVYILSHYRDTWEQLKREHPGNYYKTSLVRALYSLAVTPGPRQNNTQTLKLDGAQFYYQIDTSGDILVYGLEIDSAISAPVTDQATGLYRVNKDKKEWKTNSRRRSSMKHSHRWHNSHYAAVSGKFDNKEEAGRLLIEHIVPAYNALKPGDLDVGDKHYSLFWQNGQYQKEANSRALTALIQQAQANDARINWLVHGEGAGTFVQALQNLTKQPGISSLVAEPKNLAKQSVFFSNPRGKNTRKEELKTLCNAAGMHLAGVNINRYDMKNPDARQKAQDEAIKLLSKGGLGGAGAAFGVSAIGKGIDMVTPATTTLAVIGIGAAGYVVAKDALSKYSGYARNIKSTVGNTWGSGNKQWVA